MKKTKLDETMRVTAHHVGEINSLHLADPRTDENCKVYYERKGVFVVAEKVYEGSYIVYNNPMMERSYAGVFVADNLSEDAGISPVTLVAMDPARNRVVNRTQYRARVNEKRNAALFRSGK